MSDEQGYNGWTNYETWTVKLHLDNEYFTYQEMKDVATTTGDDVNVFGTISRAYLIGQRVKEYVEEMVIPDDNDLNLLQLDMIQAALSEVNWREIGESYANDYPCEGDDDEDEDEEGG